MPITITLPKVEGLPKGWVVAYSGRIDENRLFVIFEPKKRDYTKFQVAVGPADNLQKVAVRNVVRYRDGGTTDVETDIGNFHFPSPLGGHGCGTFNGVPLVSMF